MKEQIPVELINLLQEGARQYTASKATTDAGVVLRLIAKFIPVSLIIKLFAHKLK
jgi:hypothetical protein